MKQVSNKIPLSIIVVYYGGFYEFEKCLESLLKISAKHKDYEYILVDNSSSQKISNYVDSNYKFIKYYSTGKNLGWGGGRNFGIKRSRGKYVLLLDSDILINDESVTKLYEFIKKHKKVGVASPQLTNISGSFHGNASRELTPLRGVFFLSFLNKLFPNLPIVKEYLMLDWDRKTTKKVEVSQLAAFMMRRDAYESVSGFDENIFLYFEENDFSSNLKKNKWELYLLSTANVTHLESKGTKKSSQEVKSIFNKSRFYYFRKHYGVLSALIVEAFARMSKELFLVGAITLIAAFLRFYRFFPNLIFNGEMGTDYLNVWGMLHGTHTWLIGPRTSHEWFFIPPLAYWIYMPVMLLGKYSPIAINVFWGIIGVLAIPASYYYIKKMFSEKIALISSFLIAVSPAWIAQTRASRYTWLCQFCFCHIYIS